ncbi:capsular polysaccharide export protein, LipB/KpsS family [Thermocrinis sp.]
MLLREKLLKLPLYSYKLSQWKRYIVKRFVKRIEKNILSQEELERLKAREEFTLIVWGTTLKEEGISYERAIRVEDGFVRSVGLGYRLNPPVSLAFDSMGIYYDSTEPSELEYILMHWDFPEELLVRANGIIQMLKKYRITKYNLKEKDYIPPKTTKEIVVVPGQVETDRSIKYGSPYVKTNLELLKKVRERKPDAYIVYKPHPDVVRGYRKGEYPKKLLLDYCDEVCEQVSSLSLVEVADEVHTISSLFGFEALIHGKKVVCYGQPFYSGYGLTEDVYPVPRRGRKLNLQQLIAGSVIIYPVYVSLYNDNKISPERAILELVRYRDDPPVKWKLWGMVQVLLEPVFRHNKW